MSKRMTSPKDLVSLLALWAFSQGRSRHFQIVGEGYTIELASDWPEQTPRP